MANTRSLQRSFAGGEISPEMFGRIDDAKYQSGLAVCRNFIVKPQGPVENRPGFAFVREVKDSSAKVRLIPFTFSTTQTVVIEMGAGYFRFHTDGGTLLQSNGQVYEIDNPYLEGELFDIHYVQSNDVLTLVHPNHCAQELRRVAGSDGAPVDWRLVSVVLNTVIACPGYIHIEANGHTKDSYRYSYKITSVGADGITESWPSAAVSVRGNLFETGATVGLFWTPTIGASKYNIYKGIGGVFGLVGQVAYPSDVPLPGMGYAPNTKYWVFVDDNIAPDLSKTPPIYDESINVFSILDPVVEMGRKYPGAVAYFEQRRCFAGTLNEPQTIWMTKSATESNMAYSLPSRADDRIKVRVAAREANTIRHIVPLTELIILTSSAEWRVAALNSDALTPSNISVRPQSYIGASNVQPLVVNNTCIYGAARGGHVRELAFDWQAGGFVSGDLSLRASHLFEGLSVVDMAYVKAPQPIAWFVNSKGVLLGLTYLPEQQIGAWHRHDTDGVFESCAAVAERDEDVLYCVVRRTINGASVRYIERMASRRFTDQSEAFFVDCGLTARLPEPRLMISGLGHLEGKTVSILADGAVHPQCVVTNGTVVLEHAAQTVCVGLPIVADLQTLPLALQLQDSSFGQGRYKNVNRVWLRVHRSSGVFVGPDADHLTEAKQRTTEPCGSPPRLKSEEIPLVLTPSWADSGQLCVRQSDPLPLKVVGLTLEVALGG